MIPTRYSLLLVVALPFVVGCPPGPPAVKIEQTTRETQTVIDTVRQNAMKLDRALWCGSVNVSARFRDGKKTHSYHLEGSLLFRAPRDLRIDLRPGLGDKVMGVGSNSEDYWVWIEPDAGIMRWGRHRYAGMPCADKAPVQPNMLASLLGLADLPASQDGGAGPTRKTTREYEILTYERPSSIGESTHLDRKYFVDRRPPYLIRLVAFYDESGRRIVSALLDNYRQPWPDGPWVAHKVNVQWPLDDGSFTLNARAYEGRTTFSPSAFVRPSQADLPKGVKDIVQVDASCDSSPGTRSN